MEIIELIKVIILGIVEGITEWLPISSTGHMILVDEFIKLNVSADFLEMFLVVIQLGAILAVVVLYWKKLIPFDYKNRWRIKKDTFSMWFKIIFACLPAAVVGLLFDDQLNELFYNPLTVAIALIVFGVLFIFIENYNKGKETKINSLSEITYNTALIIGIFQLIAAVFPGTSRSGATIVGALLIGVSRTVAAEFTFFLAIPVMFGASLLKLVKFGFAFTTAELLLLVKWLNKKEIMERSYGELMENVVSTRKGLLAEGFEGKHIALIGTSSVEWMESYLGIITGCTTAVPLDAALPCEDLIDLLNRSDSAALFLSPKLRPYLDAFLENCPKLQKVWMLQEEVEDAPAKVYGIGELRNAGKSASADSVCPDAEDIATIIFTSGTTGKSKGVMLTQNNLASNVEAVKITAEAGTAVLSVLPIHHAFCLVMDWLKGFSLGATLCINDSLLHMVRNMSIFKPDIMLMVPMMIETIYKRLAAADPSIPKAVLAEKVFGGKLRIIFTGGAHLDPYYIDRFAEYGVEVLEGYGMSECSPVISNNTLENNKKGSIGKPLENAEIRFENGEILVKGSSVMKGYYQMPDETAETLKDGWLHTGDKGYMDEDGYLFINGRVKNLIILSNGENVSPEEIENKLALNPLVGEVIVTGEDNGLTARIYPEQAVVEAKALDAEAIQTQLQAFLDEYNRNQPTYRRITGLVVRKNPFIRNTTKKIRRQDVLIDEPLE